MRRLTTEELRALVPGRRVQLAEPDYSPNFEEFHREGLYIYVVHRGIRHQGSWKILGGELCVELPSQPGLNRCRKVLRDLRGVHHIIPQGPPGGTPKPVVFQVMTDVF